jgi:uncharacterized protein (TIGR00255 family)
MITGMTGFGSADKSFGKMKFVLEIKSQNHRYLDIVFYLPPGFAAIENKIREILNKEIQRGRVTVSLKIIDKSSHHLVFNRDIVKEYLRHAQEVKKEFHLINNLGIADILRLPGVFETRETVLNVEGIWPIFYSGVSQSLRGLLAMRKREGRSLAADLRNVLNRMLMQIKKIEARSKILLSEKKKNVSPDEFLSYQKGCDINEELIRLKHYIEEFKNLLKTVTVVGKKLDFVAQEMQRETNTIGSKVQDPVISNAVIALKSKIEKLREQAQNVE